MPSEIHDRRRWRRFRLLVLDRDGWKCRLNAEGGCDGRLEVDHVVPVVDGGRMWLLENAQALCRRHHILKTQAENQRRRRAERPPPAAVAAWRAAVDELRR